MKRTIIITILLGIISSVSTFFLLSSMEGFKTEIKESKIAVKEMKAQVNSIEDKYKAEIQYWIIKNNDLQMQIQQTETYLNLSKQKEKSLQDKIRVLISESRNMRDTSEIVSNCDSLKENVNQFVTETNVRDSLCDSEISELKDVIQNKDSAMAGCERSFFLLRQVLDSSFTFQNKLTDELSLADKKIKRGNLKTKFLSAGAMILATTTTILLLKK